MLPVCFSWFLHARKHRNPRGQLSGWLVLAGLFLSSSLACQRPSPVPTTGYFQALADCLPEESDELVWIVERLCSEQRLTAEQCAAFTAAFPNLRQQNRRLTEEDRAVLRSLP